MIDTTPTNLAVGASIAAGAATTVTVIPLGDGDVSVRIGDDRQAITLCGPLDFLRWIVVQAAAELGYAAAEQDRSR